MEKGRIMAVDYGTAKIGLAVTDPDRIMAFGRGLFRKLSDQQAIEKIWQFVISEEIVKVVIGLPMGRNDQETVQTRKIRNFADKLTEKAVTECHSLEIDFIDESFSTFEAGRVLQEIGATAEQKKATEDELAAIILLHRYIDFRP